MRVIIKNDKEKGKVETINSTTATIINSTTPITSVSILEEKKSDETKISSPPMSIVVLLPPPPTITTTELSTKFLPDTTIKSLLLNRYNIPPPSRRSGGPEIFPVFDRTQQDYPLPPFKTLKRHLAGSTFCTTKLADGSPHYEIDRTVYHEQESKILEKIMKTFERPPLILSSSSTLTQRKRGKSKDSSPPGPFLRSTHLYENPSILEYCQQQDPQSLQLLFRSSSYNKNNNWNDGGLTPSSYGWSFIGGGPRLLPPPNSRLTIGSLGPNFGYGYFNSSTISSRGGTTPHFNNSPNQQQKSHLFSNPPFSSQGEHSSLNPDKWQPDYETFGTFCCPCGCCSCCPDTECWTPNSSNRLPSSSTSSSRSRFMEPPPICYPCPCGCTQDMTIQRPPYIIAPQQQQLRQSNSTTTIIGSSEESESGIQIIYDNSPVRQSPYNSNQRLFGGSSSSWIKTTPDFRTIPSWSKNISFPSSSLDLTYDWRKLPIYPPPSQDVPYLDYSQTEKSWQFKNETQSVQWNPPPRNQQVLSRHDEYPWTEQTYQLGLQSHDLWITTDKIASTTPSNISEEIQEEPSIPSTTPPPSPVPDTTSRLTDSTTPITINNDDSETITIIILEPGIDDDDGDC